MQKQKLEILQPRELLKILEDAFTTIPIVPKDCVRALNKLSYNLIHQQFTQELYNSIIFLVLRGFTSKDNYLKAIMYTILERISSKTGDGIVAVSSIIKDIDDKNIPITLKNSANRTLFTYLPKTMKGDFLKLIKISLLDDRTRDNSVCIASEFFKDMSIDSKVLDEIDDYHLCFFNNLPINCYSSMIEIPRMVEKINISKYLTSTTDSVTFFEAAKALTKMKQEIAVLYIDKAVSTLKNYLKKDPIEQLASLKILNKLSLTFPSKVAKANNEISNLIDDSSRTVGMLAILTLLKTGDAQTARQLSKKLESLMHIMSESYKMMAIETIEKLSTVVNEEFVVFLKNVLFAKGSVEFKRFILKKIETVMKTRENNTDILKFLCSYIEDPQFYQISMDILGIVSGYIVNSSDLIHIYNRIILENSHVRHSVYQALYDINDKLDTCTVIETVDDPETLKLRSFLVSNQNLKKGPFDLNELGDLRDEVLKYLDQPLEDEKEDNKPQESFIKDCRSVDISPEHSDVYISVIKRIFKDHLILSFTLENKMKKVVISSGLLSLVCNNKKYKLEITKEDFDNQDKIIKEIELPVEKKTVINGAFEYQIYLEDDINETEDDVIQLMPFDVNILDFIYPSPIKVTPSQCKSINLKFKLKPTDAISKIVGVCNMFLMVEKDSFEVQGLLNEKTVVIRGQASYSKHTTVNLEVLCDDNEVIDEIIEIFD